MKFCSFRTFLLLLSHCQQKTDETFSGKKTKKLFQQKHTKSLNISVLINPQQKWQQTKPAMIFLPNPSPIFVWGFKHFSGDANISLFFGGWSLTLELLRFRRVASFNPLPHPKKHAADGSRNPVNSPVEGNASFILSFFDKVSTKHPRWLFSRISEPSRSSSSNYRRWIGDY